METREAIFQRRSCREYTEEKVTHEEIEELLHAAFSAPTEVNAQPWEFVVWDISDRVKNATGSGYPENA